MIDADVPSLSAKHSSTKKSQALVRSPFSKKWDRNLSGKDQKADMF